MFMLNIFGRCPAEGLPSSGPAGPLSPSGEGRGQKGEIEMEDTMNMVLDMLADALAEKVMQRMESRKETYTVEDLAARYGCSKCTIRRKIAAGEFGEPVALGERTKVVTAAGVRQFEKNAAAPAGRRHKTEIPVRRSGKLRGEPGPI